MLLKILPSHAFGSVNMKITIHRLEEAFDFVVTAFFLLNIICVILQVFARYVIKVSIPFTEELSRYMLIAFGMLGMAICSREGEHLGAFFIRDKSKKAQPYFFIFNSLVVIVVGIIYTIGGISMIKLSGDKTGSTMTWFPLWLLYLFFLIGIIFATVYAARDLVYSIQVVRGKKQMRSGASSPVLKEGE